MTAVWHPQMLSSFRTARSGGSKDYWSSWQAALSGSIVCRHLWKMGTGPLLPKWQTLPQLLLLPRMARQCMGAVSLQEPGMSRPLAPALGMWCPSWCCSPFQKKMLPHLSCDLLLLSCLGRWLRAISTGMVCTTSLQCQRQQHALNQCEPAHQPLLLPGCCSPSSWAQVRLH